MTTKTEIERQIKICYAGQSAEKLILNDISDGAGSDITKATRLLNLYVSKYGMDDTFGAVDLEVLCPNAIESPALSRVQTLAATFTHETIELLRENINLLYAVANALIQQETLSGDEVLKAIKSADDIGSDKK
ncbi:hypothetical protein AGMMS49975_14860 [Clostridia bacterium]|nr:hypothetical protein AGMMS49975_14860 [Clostridia bacterium]